jgi:hypothetical protein
MPFAISMPLGPLSASMAAALALAPGCGGGAGEQRIGPVPRLLHSPELSEIMKTEVNQPFSAMMFLVFHADDVGDDGELDYARLGAPVTTLLRGVTKVRSMMHPPVQTPEAKEVFLTYVDALVRDSELLFQAYEGRDRPQVESLLQKITHTCNDCHHFFRLKVVGEGPPPPSVVMVEPAIWP